MRRQSMLSVRGGRLAGCGSFALLLAYTATTAAAQTVAERVAGTRTGSVMLHFETRPGVCGDGGRIIGIGSGQHRITQYRGGTSWSSGSGYKVHEGCLSGPAYLLISTREGAVTRVRVTVGPRIQPNADVGARDLGEISADNAMDFLVGLAERSDGYEGDDALFAASLAAAPPPWARVLRIARAEDRPRKVRRQATDWLAAGAGEAVVGGDGDPPRDTEREVRESAVFALSQRPRSESVPALLKVARTNRDPWVRQTALFWLGQSADVRALDLFEELLLRR